MVAQNVDTPTPPVGVIESLARGFEIIASHLTLLLLPLTLDLLLWLGPRVSFSPLIEMTQSSFLEVWELTNAQQTAQGVTWEDFSEWLALMLGGKAEQYFPLVGIPSLMAAREAKPLPFGYDPPRLMVRTLADWLGVRLVSTAVSLCAGGLYVMLIAGQVQDGQIVAGRILRRMPAIVVQLFLLSVLVPVVLTMIFMPFLLLATALLPLSSFLARVMVLAGLVMMLWVSLFGVFTIHAMLINRRNLLAAIWDSVRVVQWNMSATLFLFLLVVLVSSALNFVWSLAAADSWLVLLGMVGNAFISTGLITATFVFFKDRYRYWKEMRDELLARLRGTQA